MTEHQAEMMLAVFVGVKLGDYLLAFLTSLFGRINDHE